MSSPFYQQTVPADTSVSDQQNYIKNMLLVKTDQLNNASNSTKRMIEFNESYRKKQSDYNWLVIYVIIAMIIFVFFVALKFFIPTIPQIVMDVIYTHIFGILLFIIFVKLYFIWSRNNMNYDEINVNVAVPNPNSQNGNITNATLENNLLMEYFTLTGKYSIENINGVHYIYFKDGDNSSIKYNGTVPTTVNVLMVGKGGNGTTTPPSTYTAGVGGGVAIGTIDLIRDALYSISVNNSNTMISQSGSGLITILPTTTSRRQDLSGSLSTFTNISKVGNFDANNSYQWMDSKTYAGYGRTTSSTDIPLDGPANTGKGGDSPNASHTSQTNGGTGIVAFAVSLPSSLPSVNTVLQKGLSSLGNS